MRTEGPGIASHWRTRSYLGSLLAPSSAWLVMALAFFFVLALALAPASAQSNQFDYELRIRSLDPSITSGSRVEVLSGGRTIRFVVEGRARANSLSPSNLNYGVGRLAVGPSASGAIASFRLVDSVFSSRLVRGEVNPAGPGGFPLTGRAWLFRSGGPVSDATASPWHSPDQNGPQSGLFPSGTNNQFGALDLDGDRIYGFDSYLGPSRSGEENPWLIDFPITPIGQFSPWRELYFFDAIIAPSVDPRTVTIQASGYMSAAVRAIDIGGGNWLMNLTSAPPASGAVTAPNFTLSINAPDLPPVQFTTIRTGTFAPPLGNGSQYSVIRASRPVTWFEARDNAAAIGGLATITSAEENNYVVTNLLSDRGDGFGVALPWLGGRRLAGAIQLPFQWSSGEGFSYTNWLSGQPDLTAAVGAGIAYGQATSISPLGWVDEDVLGDRVRDFLVELNPCVSPGLVISQTVDLGEIRQPGSQVTLSVVTQGVTGFRWRRNGVEIPAAINSSYTFTLSQATVGTYDCLLQDACSGLRSAPVDIRMCSDIIQPYSARMGDRARFGLATEPGTGRVLIFGGESTTDPRNVLNDTIVQSPLPGWSILTTPQAMRGRSEHAMGDSIVGPVVFGGRDQAGVVLGDAWKFENSTWVPLTFGPEVATPQPRASGVLAFNANRRQAVLFGGRDAQGQALGDTWVLNFSGWQQLDVPSGQGPSARWNHAITYDPRLEGLVLFGGRSESGLLSDTWLLRDGVWTQLAVSGPTPREEMTLHRDTRDQSIRMIGGRAADGTTITSEWKLDANGWTRVTQSYIYGPMFGHRAISMTTGQMFLGGGYTQVSASRPINRSYAGPTNPTIGDLSEANVGYDVGSGFVELESSGTGAINQIRWTRNGVQLIDGNTPQGSVISGSQTRRLRISGPREEDAGTYVATFSGACGSAMTRPFVISPRCGPADVGIAGAVAGSDQRLDNNDFVVFVSWFFDADRRADIGSQGATPGSDEAFDTNDFVVYIQYFFAGCE